MFDLHYIRFDTMRREGRANEGSVLRAILVQFEPPRSSPDHWAAQCLSSQELSFARSHTTALRTLSTLTITPSLFTHTIMGPTSLLHLDVPPSLQIL